MKIVLAKAYYLYLVYPCILSTPNGLDRDSAPLKSTMATSVNMIINIISIVFFIIKLV